MTKYLQLQPDLELRYDRGTTDDRKVSLKTGGIKPKYKEPTGYTKPGL